MSCELNKKQTSNHTSVLLFAFIPVITLQRKKTTIYSKRQCYEKYELDLHLRFSLARLHQVACRL